MTSERFSPRSIRHSAWRAARWQLARLGVLLLATAAALALPEAFAAKTTEPEYVTPGKEIWKRLEPQLPSRGGPVPTALASKLGAAHVAGKYCFTDQPFLIEGCKDLLGLGFRSVKLWFTKVEDAYPFHSDWNLPPNPTLLDLAKHPYFVEAFALPFEVIALEVQQVPDKRPNPVKGFALNAASDFAEDEKQIHELTAHLLKTYADRDITFLLQNWEGDWMLRGGAADQWEKGEYPDLDERAKTFARWLAARQRGVERARAENPQSRCKVLHAVEVNQVLPTWRGVPTMTSHVLPHVRTDMISWSCYDGMRREKKSAQQSAIGLWQGIETIRHFARPAHEGKEAPVYIGEIGIPEQKGFTPEAIRDIWDGSLAALFALDIPYILQWEIYDNEVREGVSPTKETFTADDLNGYWIRKPDGSLSETGKYLTDLLKKSRP